MTHGDVPPGRADTAVAAMLRDPEHGPLPALLLVLTVLTGVVDSVSILKLGRVFVANMTGNVVFVGFALSGAPGFVLSASLFALGGFLVGAAGGGAIAPRLGDDRAVLLRAGVLIELGLISLVLVLSVTSGPHLGRVSIDALAALSAVAMGTQNAVVRGLGVADLTTTVLTMTLTGIAVDTGRDGRRDRALRRVSAVAAMLAGAVAGAELVLHSGVTAALALAVFLLSVVSAGALAAARGSGGWRHSR
jgi:uncharacterized membrane protein YoaK (UPF0700 family)